MEVNASKETLQQCHCVLIPCGTYVTRNLDGAPFCLNGPHDTMNQDPEDHGGCSCHACPVRAEANLKGVLFCKCPDGRQKIPPKQKLVAVPEGYDVKLVQITTDVPSISAGATEPEVEE